MARLHHAAQTNDIRNFREASPEERARKYEQLWKELRTFAEAQALTYHSHAKIVAQMDKLWPKFRTAPIGPPPVGPLVNVIRHFLAPPERREPATLPVSDPSRYRYTPRYAYDMPEEEGREDNRGKEQRYADKRKREQIMPAHLEAVSQTSLYSLYWRAQDRQHRAMTFDGYPD